MIVVERLVATMRELKAAGLPILLVEQSLHVRRAIAERHVIIDEGRIVWTGDAQGLESADQILREHLILENA